MKQNQILFQKVYQFIRQNGELKKVNGPRMDNWSVDIFNYGNYQIRSSDGGYCKSIHLIDNGKQIWQVSDNYPQDIKFEGISPDELEAVFQGFNNCNNMSY